MKSLPEIRQSNARKSKKTAHPVGVPDMSGVSALASSLSRKPAPKKPALALDVATLRWAAAEIVVEAAQKAFDSLRWDNLTKRLRAKASRIEKARGK